MQLETMFGYQTQRQETQTVYDIRSLESLSASALYTDWGPASNLGLGPGIAREMPEAENMIERIRGPGAGDKPDADHINYEYHIPGIKGPIENIHIPLDPKK